MAIRWTGSYWHDCWTWVYRFFLSTFYTLNIWIYWHAEHRFPYRKSMEMRDSKNQESADWLKKYQLRSQAMKRTVALHAKLLDPHNSLKEVYNEKLQHHRWALVKWGRSFSNLATLAAHITTTTHACRSSLNYNLLLHAGKLTNKGWETTWGSYGTWKHESVNALICSNRWNR